MVRRLLVIVRSVAMKRLRSNERSYRVDGNDVGWHAVVAKALRALLHQPRHRTFGAATGQDTG
jgi:hypothetical protein